MGGKSSLVSLLVVSCILTSVVVAVYEPFCTSKFNFEEMLLHKIMRFEHAMELLQDEVTKNLTEFENRLANATSDKAGCRCPDAWTQFKGSCYLFLPDAVTFAEAEYNCILHQTHLVKINDADENASLKTHSSHLKADSSRWIGLTDESIEGVWEWRDRSNPGFVGWSSKGNEPNGKREQNCAALHQPFQYDWIDIGCTIRHAPICEKELTSCPPA